MALALVAGSIAIPLRDVAGALFGDGDAVAGEVVRSLRLPRALSGFACGGLLALAGALLQVLLRNPLADPYVLGISGGAGVGALLAILLGGGLAIVNGSAFLGALRRDADRFSAWRTATAAGRRRVCCSLASIVAAGCGAAVALMLSIAPRP